VLQRQHPGNLSGGSLLVAGVNRVAIVSEVIR